MISMVSDDDASRHVWCDEETGALRALAPGSLVIESSTISPSWASDLAEKSRALGLRFLDAPVVGSRPQAENGSLVHLVGGAASDVEQAAPVLAAMGCAIHRMGLTPSGAITKLAVNALFVSQVATLAELFNATARAGVDVSAMLAVLSTLPVMSPAAKVAGAAIADQRFEPLFPIGLVAKDLRYAAESARASGSMVPLVERLVTVFERAVAKGLSGENVTAIAKIYDPRAKAENATNEEKRA